MTEFEIASRYEWVAEELEELVGPRKYHLHNRIGGQVWNVRPHVGKDNRYTTLVQIEDPELATYLILKLSR